jgi:hypothetical protein
MKKFVQKIQFPLSIIVGIYVSYWLITNPFETYVLPVIIIWIPDIIGWNAFFVLLGVLAGLITLGLCGIISDEDNK